MKRFLLPVLIADGPKKQLKLTGMQWRG